MKRVVNPLSSDRVEVHTRVADKRPARAERLAVEAVHWGLAHHWCGAARVPPRSEEHTSELQSRQYLVCRLLLEKKTRIYSSRYFQLQKSGDAPIMFFFNGLSWVTVSSDCRLQSRPWPPGLC